MLENSPTLISLVAKMATIGVANPLKASNRFEIDDYFPITGVAHLKVVSRGKTTPCARPSIFCGTPVVKRKPVAVKNFTTTLHRLNGWMLPPHRFFLLNDSGSTRTRSVTHPD
jgi:hypothetical protein